MSFLSERSPEDAGDEKRAKKLAAARKKVRPLSAILSVWEADLQLKSYRASRSSITSSQSSRSGSGSPTKLSISKSLSRHPSGTTIPPLPKSRQGSFTTPSHSRTPSTSAPLGDSTAGNVGSPRRPSGSAKGKERAVESLKEDGRAHRRTGSRASHGRHGSLASRANVMGVFDLPPLPSALVIGESSAQAGRLEMPHEIITTPATPLPDSPDLDPLSALTGHGASDEELEATRSRLSSFSFGAKPPADAPLRRLARTPSPNGFSQPLPPSMALRMHDMGFKPPSPLHSPSSSHSAPSNLHRLSSTPSRPPSLLLTKPSPLPTSPGAAPRTTSSPQTPPAVSRIKRHSHSRSSSISLPNLKLAGARPNSLGVPTSPSFPGSPGSPSVSPLTSPSSDRARSTQIHGGARLKFEPSGRGAEADKEKEEYRRQALAKLTAGSSSTPTQTPISPEQEIALPDLDDAEDDQTDSPTRSRSRGWGSGLRPDAPGLSPTPSWAAEEPTWSGFGKDRWSGGSGFGFGMKDEGLGFGLDLGAVKRGSLTGGLSVLAEVEEVEELDEEEEGEADKAPSIPFKTPLSQTNNSVSLQSSLDQTEPQATPSSAPTPTPKGLRGFRLSSAASHTPVRTDDSAAAPTPPSTSPTKGYGAIGRGRPRPLANLAHAAQLASSPSTASTIGSAALVTPTSSSSSARKRGRGSSISYRKDHNDSTSTTSASAASVSSRDWSFDRKTSSPLTSTSSLEMASPTLLSLGGFGSLKWSASGPRSIPNRPCPRPKSMASQALDSGANRILSNVQEEEGDWPTVSSIAPSTLSGLGLTSEDELLNGAPGHRTADSVVFRDHTLELEMERDALREDVEGWRSRCRQLEESLESEKKESGALRDRIRKLGDRLLTMSSAQATGAPSLDERVMAQMREQFFQLTASLESERREKETALRQIEAMRAYMHAHRLDMSHISPPSPPFLSSAAGWTFPHGAPTTTGAIASPSPKDPFVDSKPLGTTSKGPDPNVHRMKAWGFPSPSETPLPSPKISPNKRDSFFGLSAMLRKRDSTSLAPADECLGIDLPPISLPSQSTYVPPHQSSNRAVSDSHRHAAQSSVETSDPQRSVSLPTSAGSSASTGAFSFISGYWRSKSSGPASAASNGSPTSTSSCGSEAYSRQSPPRGNSDEAKRMMLGPSSGRTDLRGACQCCQGPLIEL